MFAISYENQGFIALAWSLQSASGMGCLAGIEEIDVAALHEIRGGACEIAHVQPPQNIFLTSTSYIVGSGDCSHAEVDEAARAPGRFELMTGQAAADKVQRLRAGLGPNQTLKERAVRWLHT